MILEEHLVLKETDLRDYHLQGHAGTGQIDLSDNMELDTIQRLENACDELSSLNKRVGTSCRKRPPVVRFL